MIVRSITDFIGCYCFAMATIRDVAEKAGVSKSVVSAALNGSSHVRMRPAVRERVLRIVAEMNYVPNHAARSLSLSRSGLVAAVMPHLINPVYEDMLRGIQDAAEESGYVVLLTESSRVRAGTDLLRRLIDEGRADGILIRSPATLAPFASRPLPKLPIVQLDAGASKTHGSVRLDNVAGAAKATQHLIDLGHERIALIGGIRDSYSDRQRREGFREALHAGGLTVRQRWIRQDGFTPEDGYRLTRELLTEGRVRPTAIVVTNSTTATGALAAAADLKLSVPGDLSIIGFHDITPAKYIRPALTTVKMPIYELGTVGLGMLITMINGQAPDDVLITDPLPHIIERESTGPPR